MSKLGHIEKQPGQVYLLGNLIVAPNPCDKALAYLYLMFSKQEILPRVFYEWQGEIGLRDFLDWYTRKDAVVLGCYKQDTTGSSPEIVGLGWMSSVNVFSANGSGEWRRGDLGEAFLRHIPMAETFQFGHMMLEWAFEEAKMNVLFGSTPAANRPAVIYAKRMGFKEIGLAPGATMWRGEPCSAWLSALTREEWNNGSIESL